MHVLLIVAASVTAQVAFAVAVLTAYRRPWHHADHYAPSSSR